MKLEKQNVCVFIENEAHLQQARELLERYGEVITQDGTFDLHSKSNDGYLVFGFGEWYIAYYYSRFRVATYLSKLEEILKEEV